MGQILPHRRGALAPSGIDAPRILFYSHDSFGLGHLRRNLTLAQALSDALPGAALLIATGSPCATSFEVPERVEIVKLPSVTKAADGSYVPRSLPGTLESVLHLRMRILTETYLTFRPHLVIVDHQVIGLHEELLPVLEQARRHGTRTILGVRDVIDSPERVALEWGTERARWALRHAYDRICVYGTPAVFDTRREYPIPPELGASLEFVGYVVRACGPAPPRALPRVRRRVLVTVGGGEDGAERIQTYLDALALEKPGWDSTILTGPLLDPRAARQLRRRAAEIGQAEVHRFHADVPRLLADSDAVVAMAGYNTCAEILQSGKPALFLPRSAPRLEQQIRATRLQALGLGTALDGLRAVELRDALERSLGSPRAAGSARRVPLDGARNLASVAGELLQLDLEAPRAGLQGSMVS